MAPSYSNGQTVGEELLAEEELKKLLQQDEKAVLARYLNKADQVQAVVHNIKKDMAVLGSKVDELSVSLDSFEVSLHQCVSDIAQHRKQHHKATYGQDGLKAAVVANTKEIVITALIIIDFILTGKVLIH